VAISLFHLKLNVLNGPRIEIQTKRCQYIYVILKFGKEMNSKLDGRKIVFK